MALGICRRMQTTTGHRSLATPLPTVANAHHHESEYINFIITIFIKIIATRLYGVYVLRVLCIFDSSYFIMHSYGERRETKGKLVMVPMGTGFDFVFLVIKGECTGSSPLAKDRVSCGIVIVFIWLPPWLERWSFIAS